MDFARILVPFFWYWKNRYFGKEFFVAASAVDKNLSIVKYCSKGKLFRYCRATLYRFFSLLKVYFHDMQNNKWLIYQLASMEFPFACSEKE